MIAENPGNIMGWMMTDHDGKLRLPLPAMV